MPAERRASIRSLLGDDGAASSLEQITSVVDQGLDDFVVAAVDAGVPVSLALARVANELAGLLADGGEVEVEAMTTLLKMEEAGELSATQSKAVLAELVAAGGDPRSIAKAKGFEQMDEGALDAVLDAVIAENPSEWERYVGGDDKLAGFFTGKVMAATRGQADGKAVNAGLRSRRG